MINRNHINTSLDRTVQVSTQEELNLSLKDSTGNPAEVLTNISLVGKRLSKDGDTPDDRESQELVNKVHTNRCGSPLASITARSANKEVVYNFSKKTSVTFKPKREGDNAS